MEHKLSKHLELEKFPQYFTSTDIKGFSVRQLHMAALAEMARCSAEIFWLYIHNITTHKYVDYLDIRVNKTYDNPYSAKTINFFFPVLEDNTHAIFPLIREANPTYQHPDHYKLESHLWDSALKVKVYLNADFLSLSGDKKVAALRKILKDCKIQALTDKNDYLKNGHSSFAQHLYSLNWPKRMDKNTSIDNWLAEVLPHELGKKRLAIIEKEKFEKTLVSVAVPNNTKSINKI